MAVSKPSLNSKKEQDLSFKTKCVTVNQSVTSSYCKTVCSHPICNKAIRNDENKVEARLDEDNRRHPDDLVDRYNKNQKVNEVVAEYVLNFLGLGPTELTPKQGKDLQPY